MKKITEIKPVQQGFIAGQRKLKTAAYARVSTGQAEQLESLSAQVEHYTDYIKSNSDWEFAGVYIDAGISGTKAEKRFEWLRLIRDCENRKVDFIVTKSISRFARNTVECLETVRKLLDLGVGVYFEKENLHTLHMDGELMLSLLSSIASDESRSISLNSKWAIKKRFQKGTFKLFSPPYGYDYDGQGLVINKEQAKIVQRIFAETLQGRGSRVIALGLNAEGILPQRGTHWFEARVRALLSNERYIGAALLQKTYTDETFHRYLNRGEEDQYYIADNHEAIISKEDFEAVENILQQRRLEKGNTGESNKYQKRYAFSGKIICGACGNTFKRKINTKAKDTKYVGWVCNTHIDTNTNGQDCSMLFIKEEQIKEAFVVMMNKLYTNRSRILQPLLENLKSQDSDGQYANILNLNQEIQKLLEQVQHLTSLMTQGYLEPALFYEENNRLQMKLAEVKEQRAILQGKNESQETTISKTEELVKYFFKEADILEIYDENLFLRFVEKITVLSRKELQFHLKNGLCFTERMEG